jgi:flagellar biosynthesis component FlhA
MSLPKILGIVASILGILAVLMGTPLFVVNRVEASAVTTRTEMKESLQTHGEAPHKGAVSKDVYVEHVKLADERHQESKEERKEILAAVKALEKK